MALINNLLLGLAADIRIPQWVCLGAAEPRLFLVDLNQLSTWRHIRTAGSLRQNLPCLFWRGAQIWPASRQSVVRNPGDRIPESGASDWRLPLLGRRRNVLDEGPGLEAEFLGHADLRVR